LNHAKPAQIVMLLEHPFRVDSRVLKEARSLAAAGYRVTVLALGDDDLPSVEQQSGFAIKRLKTWTRNFRRPWSRPLRVAEVLIRFAWAALRANGDVYHSHHTYLLPSALIASIVRRRPLIYDSHELAFALPGRTGLNQRLFLLYERFCLRFVSVVIMANDCRTPVFKRVHNYTKQIPSVYNCPILVKTPVPGRDIRDLAGIPKSTKVVLYIGVPGLNRGLGVAIRCLRDWPDDTNLVCMGPRQSHEETELINLAETLGVADRVRFIDPVPADDVPGWASTAEVGLTLIQPEGLSYSLSAPTKLFELLMAGVPQIASDFPEMRIALIDNGVGPAGILVDPSDSFAVSDGVSRLLNDSELASEMGRNAMAVSRDRYNWATQELVLLEIYRSLLVNRDGATEIDGA